MEFRHSVELPLNPAAGSVKPHGDNPIRRPDEDTLGRASAARSFANQVLGLDASEGVVVGVVGPWGSGKTSFVNLTRDELERAGLPVLEFNPWMFSGAQQLVESFFIELTAPVVGSWIERLRIAVSLLGKSMERRKEGVGARRAKLGKALAKLDRPILVFVDDIDRLSTPEIRDIFKLVRLTASFPNLIYIVAFDRLRVEHALGEEGVPGRDYLEKILQIAFDLPAVPNQVLIRQMLSEVDRALAGIENRGPFDEQAWTDILTEIIAPLIRNMRDARRYVAALKGTVVALNGQVELADVLALEAVRVFLPDVFAQLHGAVSGLTTTSDSISSARRDSPELKAKVDNLIEAGKMNAALVRAIVSRLFPVAMRHLGGSHYTDDWQKSWLAKRRVANEHILRFYLERVVGEGLRNFADAEQAWAYFNDRSALDGHLRSLDKERLQDVIASLEGYEDQFGPECVVPATIVLLNLLPYLPKRQKGMFELDTRFVVGRVTYRLLRSLTDPAAVEAAVRQILPELSSLSSKLALITQVGHRENAGHKLVSENAAAEVEKCWRNDVRTSSVAQLIQERDLVRVLLLTKRETDPSLGPLMMDSSPELTLALLRSARGEVLSHTLGNRAVRRYPRLEWDALIELYGGEPTLRERIEALRTTHPDGIGDLLELADKYLSGWRPNRNDYSE